MDWSTAASIATAFGTLVLAIATFASIRSARASARLAERSLLAGMRPVLFPSRDDDPEVRVRWMEQRLDVVPGGHALFEVGPDAVYMAINVRNVGAGLAVLHAWHVRKIADVTAVADPPPVEDFRRQSRDLFIPPNGTGFWQGAVRGVDDPDRRMLIAASERAEEYRIIVDLLYGDLEGGQRTISRFTIFRLDGDWRADVLRHWFIDNPDPR